MFNFSKKKEEMKTKKELTNKAWKVLAFVAIVLGSFAMASCGDDDDEKEGRDGSSIVGTWELVKGYYSEDGDDWWESVEKGDYDRYTFNADGTYINEWKYGDSSNDFEGTYTYDNNTGKLMLDSSDDMYDVLTLNSSSLVWEQEEMISGDRVYSKEYFKRR